MRDWQLLIQLPVSNLYLVDGKLVLAANGEIYNHREL
jgi:asparagine synthetase B (glutamine-hydrolysing)